MSRNTKAQARKVTQNESASAPNPLLRTSSNARPPLGSLSRRRAQPRANRHAPRRDTTNVRRRHLLPRRVYRPHERPAKRRMLRPRRLRKGLPSLLHCSWNQGLPLRMPPWRRRWHLRIKLRRLWSRILRLLHRFQGKGLPLQM